MSEISSKIRKITSQELSSQNIAEYLPRGQSNLDQIKDIVQKILNTVKECGDSAIIDYTNKFDGVDIKSLGVEVSEKEIDEAFEITDPNLINALKSAKENILKFHKAQIKSTLTVETIEGVKASHILRPIESAGLYIPGGKAVYPSSVLMEAVPAKAAGVKKLVLCSPPQKNGKIAPAILVAARLCNVNQIFRCGGAQAIAGMAYGTESIPAVQKIVGPGNKWVNAAKQLVSNFCGIDNPAGPSEILLVTDETTNPLWAAYDLLAQAEHGPENVSVLLCENESVIRAILIELNEIVARSPRKEIINDNLEKYGLVILSKNKEETIRIINLIATEHLHINTDTAKEMLPYIYNAGAIFLGPTSPVPLGDYCAGTNHVLPTAGYARVYSGLSTFDFMKMIDVLDCSPQGLSALSSILKPIAEFEGLIGHRDCVMARLNPKQKSLLNRRRDDNQ